MFQVTSFGYLFHEVIGLKKQWLYEFKLFQNSTIFISVFKIIVFATAMPIALIVGLELSNGFDAALWAFTSTAPYLFLIMFVLFLLAYLLLALLYGGRYWVIFILDEKGIYHIQMKKQFKRNQVIALLTTLSGALAGNPATMGAGLLSGSRQMLYSDFSKVKKIRIQKRKHVLYLDAPFNHNQIYVEQDDFDTVSAYIIAKCPQAKVKG